MIWRSQDSWHAPGADEIHDSRVTFLEDQRQLRDTHSLLTIASNDPSVPENRTSADRLDYQQRAFWMGLSAKGSRVVDERGFVIYVASDTVPGEMFRGWAEIMRDGKRIARSGLVGPRFVAPEAAKQCAMDWAHRWIERGTRWESDLLQSEAARRSG